MAKRKTSTARRRPAKRPRRRRKFNPRRSLVLSGFPKMKVAKLRYVDFPTLDAQASALITRVYSANGCYDPLWHVGGKQPTGFDQWMAVYNHYTVLGSRITVTPVQMASGTVGIVNLLLTSSATEPTGFTSVENMLESRTANSKLLISGVNGQLPKAISTTKNFSAKKFFGIRNFIGKADYKGDNASQPAEGAFFHVCHSAIGANNPGVVSFIVKIDYIVAFTEPRIIQDL